MDYINASINEISEGQWSWSVEQGGKAVAHGVEVGREVAESAVKLAIDRLIEARRQKAG